MNINFTVDTESAEDITKAMGFLTGLNAILIHHAKANAETPPDPDTDADKKAKAKAKRVAKAAAEKAAEAVTAEAETSGDDDTGDSIDRETVRAALKAYAALEGKDAAIVILKDHGSPSIGELDEEQFAAVLKACE